MSTATETSLELVELGRFFTITARRFDAGQAAPQMFSTAIDAAWHRLMEDPQSHDAFTTAHAGLLLEHSPVSGSGLINWISGYEEAYGPLPEVWFTNADGTVNEQSLAQYRETGTVVAEWNCGPKPADPDAAPTTTR